MGGIFITRQRSVLMRGLIIARFHQRVLESQARPICINHFSPDYFSVWYFYIDW